MFNINEIVYICENFRKEPMIQVTDRIFDILEMLAIRMDHDFSLAEIVADCGLKKSTCANILRSLQERGYVEHTGKMRGYRLGHMAYRLTGSHEYFNRLGETARPDLEHLFAQTAETVVFATENHDKRVILHTIECQQGITARINHSTNLYRSSAGRIMLAFYPEEKAASIISRIGLPDADVWKEAQTPDALKECLADIRRERICFVHNLGDILGIAVPVFKEGDVFASVGVCLPEYRCDAVRRASIVTALEECARRIEAKL